MKIYNYHPVTKELLSEGIADESPLEPGVYLIPAHATKKKPPTPLDGKAIIFDGEWKHIDVEGVASVDTDNTSPSTETAFTKLVEKMKKYDAEIVELKGKLKKAEDGLVVLTDVKGRLNLLETKDKVAEEAKK